MASQKRRFAFVKLSAGVLVRFQRDFSWYALITSPRYQAELGNEVKVSGAWDRGEGIQGF